MGDVAERTLAIDQATYGPGQPYVAALRYNLADILSNLGSTTGD